MTRKQRLEAVIAGDISEELIADCREELEKLNERSEAAKAEPTEQQKENKVLEDEVVAYLEAQNGPVQIVELVDVVSLPVKRQRLTAVCTNLLREGRIAVCDVKVKGKGKRKAYYIER